MMENGLYQFYPAHYKYLNNLKTGFELSRQHNNSDDDIDYSHALTMEQMIRPLYLVIGLLILSLLAFFGEVIIFKWKARRERMHKHFQH